jgi:DNA-3-methyladenine glycosylase
VRKKDNYKLQRAFFSGPAVDSARNFLGKVLVHNSPAGRLTGVIYDVEAYPAFVDQVHHGNKRTPRTEVMWGPPGRAYVYLIYGTWYQFAVVVNVEGIPDVVFIRAAYPLEGVPRMKQQWGKHVEESALANSPGKLCKSFIISRSQYGADLCGDALFLEDWGYKVEHSLVRSARRVGINKKREGFDDPLRFFLSVKEAEQVLVPQIPTKTRP